METKKYFGRIEKLPDVNQNLTVTDEDVKTWKNLFGIFGGLANLIKKVFGK